MRAADGFFFRDRAPTWSATLSLHDALPILYPVPDDRTADDQVMATIEMESGVVFDPGAFGRFLAEQRDRKSTRLNSSHRTISYAVFCLKKKRRSSSSSAMPHRTRWPSKTCA